MLYLSGTVRSEIYDIPGTGFLLTPHMGNRPFLSRTVWGADTGLFGGEKGYSDDGYLAWLKERAQYRFTNLFATAPDVIGNAEKTLERSLPMLSRIRELGYRVAFVAQDGSENQLLPFNEFDVLFLGGTNDFKLSEAAVTVTKRALAHGRWVHMGRVNSKKRMLYAAKIGCDSADGTFLKYGPDKNIPRMMSWIKAVREWEEMERAA